MATRTIPESGRLETSTKTQEAPQYSLLRHILSIPFIYSMLFPLVFLDFTLTIYQHVCFRLFGIPRVRRANHIIVDRQRLDYLSGIQKLNCIYCGYGNGVVSYALEIVSETEQYWCPIKHEKSPPHHAQRYESFLEYGDSEEFATKASDYRESLRNDEP